MNIACMGEKTFRQPVIELLEEIHRLLNYFNKYMYYSTLSNMISCNVIGSSVSE